MRRSKQSQGFLNAMQALKGRLQDDEKATGV